MRLRRTVVALGVVGLGVSALACSAILGLEDRTLRQDAGGTDASPPDADAASCNDAGFCACSQHDFCDDFDSYLATTEISKRWTNTLGYASPLQLFGTSRFDTTEPLPSSPNALLVRTEVSQGKAGIASYFVQVDGKKLHTQPVVGVKVAMQLRIDAIDPADGSTPLVDGGGAELVSVMALVSGTASDGVGLLLSEVGGYVGYALNVNDVTKASIAQGLPFANNKLVVPAPLYFPFTVIVAPRNSPAIGTIECNAGPLLSTGDGGPPDADVGPNPLVVLVIPPLGVGSKVCEILGGALLDPTWVQNPLLAIGGIESGHGVFQAAFDNVTIDFLTE